MALHKDLKQTGILEVKTEVKHAAPAAIAPKPLFNNNEIEIVTAPALHTELIIFLKDDKSYTYKIFQKYLELTNDADNSIYLPGANVELKKDKTISVALQDASPLNIVFKEAELSKISPINAWKPAAFLHAQPLQQPENKLQADNKDNKFNGQLVVRDIELLEQDAPIKAQKAAQKTADDWRNKYWDKALEIIELAKKEDSKLEAFKLLLGPELYRVNQEISNELHHNYFSTKELEVKNGFYTTAHLVAEVYENKLYYSQVWEEYNSHFIKLIPEKIRKLNVAINWLKNDFASKIEQNGLAFVQPMIDSCVARIKYYKDIIQNFTDLKQEFDSLFKAFEKHPDMRDHDFRFHKIQVWIEDCVKKLPASAKNSIQLNGKQKAYFENLLKNSLKYSVNESIDQLKTQYKKFSETLAYAQGLTNVQLKTNFIDPMLSRHEEALTLLSEKFFLNDTVRSFQDDMNLTRLREGLLRHKESCTKECIDAQLKQLGIQESLPNKEVEVINKFRIKMNEWYRKNILNDDDNNPQDLVEEIIESDIGKVSVSLVKSPATGNTLMHELMLNYKMADNQGVKKRILNLIEVLYSHGGDPYVVNLAGKNAFENADLTLNSLSDWRLIALDLKYAITFSDFAESTRKKYAKYTYDAANANFIERLISNEQINLQRLNRMYKISAAIKQSARNIDDNNLIDELRKIVSADSKNDWPKGIRNNSKVSGMARAIIRELDDKRLVPIGPNMQIQVSELKDQVKVLQADRADMKKKYDEMMSILSGLQLQGVIPKAATTTPVAFFQPADEKNANPALKLPEAATTALALPKQTG